MYRLYTPFGKNVYILPHVHSVCNMPHEMNKWINQLNFLAVANLFLFIIRHHIFYSIKFDVDTYAMAMSSCVAASTSSFDSTTVMNAAYLIAVVDLVLVVVVSLVVVSLVVVAVGVVLVLVLVLVPAASFYLAHYLVFAVAPAAGEHFQLYQLSNLKKNKHIMN